MEQVKHRSFGQSLATPQNCPTNGDHFKYLTCGVQLGWLFNPHEQQVEIYRQGHSAEVKSLPTTLSGEGVLPGFQLSVERFAD
nr:Uma2 family endonuclease [Acaryochloris sp. IP29b_bin.137]